MRVSSQGKFNLHFVRHFLFWTGVLSDDGAPRFFERSARDEEALTALYADPRFFSVLRLPGFSGPGLSVWALAEVDCSSVKTLFHKFWISASNFSRYVFEDSNYSLTAESAILMIFSV